MSDERKIARNGRLFASIMGQQLGYATSVRSCQAVEDRDTLVWRKRYRGTRHSRYQERGKRLATLCINTALACPHRDRAPERRHAQRYRSRNQPRSTKRKTCRSNFLSGGSVTFFISKTAHQAVHARMGWDHAALYLSRSTHLELLQLRLLAQ